MVVSACDQRGPRRRAKRCGVEHVVAQPAIGEALEVGGLDRTAKGAAGAKAYVIRQNEENVGRDRGSLDALWKVGRRILDRATDLAPERRLGLG
jgi:hypothetical protein